MNRAPPNMRRAAAGGSGRGTWKKAQSKSNPPDRAQQRRAANELFPTDDGRRLAVITTKFSGERVVFQRYALRSEAERVAKMLRDFGAEGVTVEEVPR